MIFKVMKYWQDCISLIRLFMTLKSKNIQNFYHHVIRL